MLLMSCALADVEIHDLKSGEKIDRETLLQHTPAKGTIVFGEEHYSLAIQKAEGDLIKWIVEHHRTEGRHAVTWEFLDYPDQKRVDLALEQWKSGESSSSDFLLSLFKNENAANKHRVYLPFLESLKLFDGTLIAGNAPREWKRIITQQGLSALNPELIPEHCMRPGDNYWERFAIAMQDHVSPEELKRYYEAQYFTDCVLGKVMSSVSKEEQKFLIVGSFHSDYNDGVISRLKLYGEEKVISIKLIDASRLSSEQIETLLKPHPKYGRIADFIYLIRNL